MDSRSSVCPAIEVADLRLTYPARHGQGAFESLKGVNLAIPVSQSVALLGPNGSGKSSLIRVLCGLQKPSGGSWKMFGSSDSMTHRVHLSVVFQSNGLDPHLTVAENLWYQSRLYGLAPQAAQQRIDEELERGQISDRRDTIVKTLSGGLMRRVDLARAMLNQPRILILDEPTVGLDPNARTSFLEAIERIKRETGMTLLMTTHLIDEADRCQRVVFMHQGRIVADGSPSALRHNLGSRILTVHDPSEHPPVFDDVNTDLDWVQLSAGGWSSVLGDDNSRIERLAAKMVRAGVSYTIAPPTLGDVFTQVTGASLQEGTEPAETSTDHKRSHRRRRGGKRR